MNTKVMFEAKSMSLLPLRAMWLTWEHQRRNISMANALSVPLFEFDFKGNPINRYFRALTATFRALNRHRPEVIFVQNPSLVLTVTALVYGIIKHIPVVVDAHNAALDRLRPGVLSWPSRFAARQAQLTIVSNENLSAKIAAQGGRPFVMPDPLPVFPAVMAANPKPNRHRVLFVCTYAPDEPYLAVLEAASRLDSDTQIYFTGNPKGQAEQLRKIAPSNVTFTGFLPEDEYIALLRSVDVLIDLTTRQDCLVCGAYEGVAAEKPLILSDTAAIREYFSRGVRYTDNSPEDLANAIKEALSSAAQMQQQLKELKPYLVADWDQRRQSLFALLMSLTSLV